MLIDLIKDKGISVYSLAKGSNVPYTTVNEIVLGKKNIMDCSIKTIMAIANYLGYQTDEFVRQITSSNSILSTTWQDAKSKSYIFPIICNNPHYEVRMIHPLKQKMINELFQLFTNIPAISKVILFGSSINIRCKSNSDIDLAILLNENDFNNDTKNQVSELIQEKSDYCCDIIWLNDISKKTKLYENIKMGLTIYE